MYDEYEERSVNEFGARVGAAVKSALQELEDGGKLVVIENLNITIRHAQGGGAVSCETHVSGEAKLTVEPDHLGAFIKTLEEQKRA